MFKCIPSTGHRSIEDAPAQSVDELRAGIAAMSAGKLELAESHVRQALKLGPFNAAAHHILGVILANSNNLPQAAEAIERSLQIRPNNADALSDLGSVYRQLGQLEKALTTYSNALRLEKAHEIARRNLAGTYIECGNIGKAAVELEKILKSGGGNNQDRLILAELTENLGDNLAAATLYQSCIERDPDCTEAYLRLARLRQETGSRSDAETLYRNAISLQPDNFSIRNEHAIWLQKCGQLDDAEHEFKTAIRLEPKNHGVYGNLGNLYQAKGAFGDAVRCHNKALELNPGDPATLNNLANAYMSQGMPTDAVRLLRRALTLNPHQIESHSALLMSLQYIDSLDPAELTTEHKNWVSKFAKGVDSKTIKHKNTAEPSRVIRLGYLSPNFSRHPVGYFIEPVLRSHDRNYFESFCFHDLSKDDDMTTRLRELSDKWVPIAGLSNREVKELIKQNRIDVLIDLAGHTVQNRLKVFAEKSSPVQVTWIGYLHSTFIEQIDYLIADNVNVPLDTRESFSETIVRLPGCFLCYGTPEGSPAIQPPPALKNGLVTFGCFNNLAKLSDSALKVWSEILHRLPDARFVIKNASLDDASTRENLTKRFKDKGFGTDRISMVGFSDTQDYFRSHHQIDIALDPFPFSGGTTTCDSLWMGVPVLTLRGEAMRSRTTASILSSLKLHDWIADSESDYVEKAIRYSRDIGGLAALRSAMRHRFNQTPLGNAAEFTNNLEGAYRRMWRGWCELQQNQKA